MKDKRATLLMRYLCGDDCTSTEARELTGDIKSARGPETTRDRVLEMEMRRTWVAVAAAAEEGTPILDVRSELRERTMVPIFEIIITHCRGSVMGDISGSQAATYGTKYDKGYES